MHKPTRVIIGTVAALAVIGGVGVGVAVANPTSSPSSAPGTPSSAAPSSAAPSTAPSSPAPSSSARQATEQGKHRTPAARALHGEFVVGAKKPHTVAVQRGEVTAASATSVAVQSADGYTATYVIGDTTKVRADQKTVAASAVKVGDRVRVVAVKDGDTLAARQIRDAGPR